MKEITKVQLIDIKKETKNVKSYFLKSLNGQNLDFLPGQFVNLYVKINNERVKRSYSIASSPLNKKYVELTIKLVPNGKVSPYMHNGVKVGDIFEISQPRGKFFYMDHLKSIVLIAAGSGIVPFMSMIRYCTEKKLDTKISLLYSSKTEKDIIYQKELEKLEKINSNLKIYHTLTRDSWKNKRGHTGRINKDFIYETVQNIFKNTYYICGSFGFVHDMAEILKEIGINRKQIKRDVWT